MAEVFVRLQKASDDAGSQAAFAAKMNLSPAAICMVLNAKREPNADLLREIGVKRVVRYEEIGDGEV